MSMDKTTGQDQLVGVFKYPKNVATNNTYFLIDWYSIKYFEGGRGGPTTYAPLPVSLDTKDLIKNEKSLIFDKEKYNTGGQGLRYYEFRDEYISPIMHATNAPTVGVFATDEGYETIVRFLADANLGSKAVIPIKLGSNIDGVNSADLRTFDAIVLYNYKYQNKKRVFTQLSDYVKKGGRLFVDTGAEVVESSASSLPELFPIENTVRTPLGSEWDLANTSGPLGDGVDFYKFDPLLFDDAEWKMSYPPNSADLRSGSTVLLAHRNRPIVVSQKLGEGKVIWSGINLPYHVSRFHNEQEILYFANIIKNLLSGHGSDASYPDSTVQFFSAQKRAITTANGKGILFNEEHYPGWRASVRSGNVSRSLSIWSAGPAYPGFMYVSLPREFVDFQSTVTFTYWGSAATWFFAMISFIAIIYIIEGVAFRGIILGNSTRWLAHTIYKRMKRWWVKDTEE